MNAVPNPLRSSAIARPAHPALVVGGETVTWAELESLVCLRAASLVVHDVAAGQRVYLRAAPSRELVVDLHALLWLGAVPVLLDPAMKAAERAAATSALRNVRDLPPRTSPVGEAPTERFASLDEEQLVILSSGSSGTPKVVSISAGQVLFSAMGTSLRLGHRLDDRWLCCLPLHHVGGLSILLRTALLGTTAVLHAGFDADAVNAALDSGDATLVSLAPVMLERVLDARDDAPFAESLRALLIGGGPMAPELLERCARIGAPVAPSWGMTEAASGIATRFPGDFDPEAGSGPPLAFSRVTTDGDALRVLGPVAPAGDLVTSDRGGLDEAGRVHVAGRADRVIISGGENISLGELESILTEHPAVAEAAVVGTEDPIWGERPHAWVVPRSSHDLTAAELERWCRDRLRAFKVPDRFFLTSQLPRTPLGKVQRSALRDTTHP